MKGGKRTGAGRPKGSPNKNQALLRDYAQKVAAGEGLDSPLETMLQTMRHLHALAIEHERNNTVLIQGEGDNAKVYTPMQLRMLAVDAAARCAVYIHPKLASVDSAVTATIGCYEKALLELGGETSG